MLKLFVNTFIKFFFLLTPFFLLTTFLSLTREMDLSTRKRTALRVTLAVVIVSVILLLLGDRIFEVFGITLNSFRIGTGILLFLSSITLVRGSDRPEAAAAEADISVVPLAIPIAVWPATTAALLVMGAGLGAAREMAVGMAGLLAAIGCVGMLLYLGGFVEKILGRQGLVILSKITGLVLAALAAEMVMNGVSGFLVR